MAKSCTGDCIQILPGNPKEGTGDVSVRVIAIPLDGGETVFTVTGTKVS